MSAISIKVRPLRWALPGACRVFIMRRGYTISAGLSTIIYNSHELDEAMRAPQIGQLHAGKSWLMALVATPRQRSAF